MNSPGSPVLHALSDVNLSVENIRKSPESAASAPAHVSDERILFDELQERQRIIESLRMQDQGATIRKEQLERQRDMMSAATSHVVRRGREMLTHVEHEAASQMEEIRQQAEERIAQADRSVEQAHEAVAQILQQDRIREREHLREKYAAVSARGYDQAELLHVEMSIIGMWFKMR